MAIPSEKTLISSEHLKKYTPINGSVDDNLLNPFIYTAQDTYLVKYLGTDLYDKIISDSVAGTITGIYLTIKDNYIPKLLCWKVYLDALDHLVVHVDNGGLLTRVSADTTPPTQRQIENLRGKAQSMLNDYTTRLIDYLCDNSSSIPEYTSNEFPDQYPNHSRSYSIDVTRKRKGLPRWATN